MQYGHHDHACHTRRAGGTAEGHTRCDHPRHTRRAGGTATGYVPAPSWLLSSLSARHPPSWSLCRATFQAVHPSCTSNIPNCGPAGGRTAFPATSGLRPGSCHGAAPRTAGGFVGARMPGNSYPRSHRAPWSHRTTSTHPKGGRGDCPQARGGSQRSDDITCTTATDAVHDIEASHLFCTPGSLNYTHTSECAGAGIKNVFLLFCPSS